ncbi:MAG: thioredoxin [Defluviitaleaceae bacterium]|nr:thioredoxin [Defluviitaleaceae bacterium]
MAAKQVTKDEFESILAQETRTILVDFYANWCGPCKVIAPILDEISGERDDVVICKINVEDAPEVASKYGVRSIPTLISFRGGEVVKRVTGSLPKEGILGILE